MFDDLDLEKIEAEDARRQKIKDELGVQSNEELELALMRDRFSTENNKDNLEALNNIERQLDELGGNKTIISDKIEEIGKEEDSNKSSEEDLENKEEILEETKIENEEVKEESKTDVEDSEFKKEWLTEKEKLNSSLKERDELLVKMFSEIQELKQKQEQPKKVEEVKEEPKKISKKEIQEKVKEAFSKISYAEEDKGAEILSDLIDSLSTREEKVVKEEFTESKFEEMLAKREQKVFAQKFEEAKQVFFSTDEGKKVLENEDMFDLYQVKFNKLQNSGKHLNPEDLFKQALEQTKTVLNIGKTNSSMASKPVPKVSDSLKEDVSKIEETKKQAVKPSSSSNAGKTADSKKFDPIDAYKEYLKSIGQSI